MISVVDMTRIPITKGGTSLFGLDGRPAPPVVVVREWFFVTSPAAIEEYPSVVSGLYGKGCVGQNLLHRVCRVIADAEKAKT